MADIVDKQTRSRMMAGIRGKDTRPEMALRRALHALGLRYRLHPKDLPGRPDIVLPRHRAVIFVHGCFWHRHNDCRFATTPSTRQQFWQAKFAANIARDEIVHMTLLKDGWRVATVWECALRRSEHVALAAGRLSHWLPTDLVQLEIGETDLASTPTPALDSARGLADARSSRARAPQNHN